MPRQQWEGDGLHTSKSVKTMYLLQWMVINLSSQHPLVRLSLSFLSVPLSSWLHASFLFLSPFFSPYNPLFVWSNLWGLSGILGVGRSFTVQPPLCSLDVTSLTVYMSCLPINQSASHPQRSIAHCSLISSTTWWSAGEKCQNWGFFSPSNEINGKVKSIKICP